jgi:uncharacterized membrane protein YecN with MAPEG domain
MPVPFIVPAYAAILALIYIFLAFRIMQLRGRVGAPIGSGGDPRLERAIRAHGNFAEYVPLALILLFAMEMQRNSIYVLHLLCIVLVLGRIIHAYGISQEKETMAFRATGMLATFIVLIAASIAVLYDYILIART